VGVGGRGRRLLRRVGLEAAIRGQIRGRRRGRGWGRRLLCGAAAPAPAPQADTDPVHCVFTLHVKQWRDERRVTVGCCNSTVQHCTSGYCLPLLITVAVDLDRPSSK
jgi:hypothetical protein